MQYIPPELNVRGFNCPHCNVYAEQEWFYVVKAISNRSSHEMKEFKVVICKHCYKESIWLKDKMIFPLTSPAPLPNPDLPEEVKEDYLEARSIVQNSPRGAAALLRLTLQKLCINLGGTGQNLNEDIALLVKNGLPPTVQQSLDIVRVIGNNAVHPGQINTNDIEIVNQLFELINLIGDYMISMPNRINGIYGQLPEGSKKAIEKRDS